MKTPKHYQLPNGFQLIDLLVNMDFCSGNVIKYLVRAGKKDGETRLKDLRKALDYLQRLIEQAEREQWEIDPNECRCGLTNSEE